MKKVAIGMVAAMALLAAGCEQNAGGKQVGGTLIGAGTGAFIGSRIGGGSSRLAATAIGGLLGAVIGSEIGKSLDRADQLHAERAYGQAFETYPTGQASGWRNPDSGNYGSVTPMRNYQRQDGTPCREFQQTITVGGRTEQGYGTACRQSDGSWRVVSG
ncbi:MAG: glycine zipper 2TM domain-containing protein [Alphaproteobacteria bacterium]|nr:glycine zipper 2TM domain-containing protein [Alphaproteobacteria bacterium]